MTLVLLPRTVFTPKSPTPAAPPSRRQDDEQQAREMRGVRRQRPHRYPSVSSEFFAPLPRMQRHRQSEAGQKGNVPMTGPLLFSAATLGIFACAAIRMNNRNDTS